MFSPKTEAVEQNKKRVHCHEGTLVLGFIEGLCLFCTHSFGFRRDTHICMLKMLRSILTAVAALAAVVSAGSALPRTDSCKCAPTDTCWPSHSDWSAFNKTIGGSLIRNVPLGSPCHDPNYDATECQRLRDNWIQPSLQ